MVDMFVLLEFLQLFLGDLYYAFINISSHGLLVYSYCAMVQNGLLNDYFL